MPTVVGFHKITKGPDHWLSSPKREELFAQHGVTNIRTFIDPKDPTQVAVVMDVENLSAFKEAMESPAAAEAMAHDGVDADSLVILMEATA
jgi:hypothetical protein